MSTRLSGPPRHTQILNRKQPLAASQKIRTGLVELRTSSGSLYARPSFWERLYLLWIFRNFHCLPKEVLGLNQRRLIDKLCQAAVRQRSIAHTDIIGIVENVQLVAPNVEIAPTTSNLIEMVNSPMEIAVPLAAVAGEAPTRWDPPADRIEVRSLGPSSKVEEISPPRKLPPSKDESEKLGSIPASGTRSGAPTRRLAWIFAGALVAAGAGVLFRIQIQARSATLANVSRTMPEARPPISVSAPVAAIALPEPVLPSVAATHVRPAVVPENQQSSAPIALPPPQVKRSHPAAARPAIATPVVDGDESTPEPRLQLAQPPESGFRYPEAPSSALTGKVSLKAFIGMDGTVRKVDILSGNPTLAGAAVRAVRHWRYSAPAMNGHAVEAESNIAINFLGDDAVSVSFPAAR